MKRTFLLTLVLCLCVTRADAQDARDDRDEARGPIITSLGVTTDQHSIVITGSGFGTRTPRVMLGSTPLLGVSVNAVGTTDSVAIFYLTAPRPVR